MTSRQDELAAWLGGGRLEEQVANGTGSITSTLYGTATANSSNGSVEVVFTDDVVNYEDEDGVVHGTNVVELPSEIDVREGDEVRIVAVGPDGFKNLTVVGVVAGGDRSKEAIAAAQTAADEANEAIEAQEQICWKDTNGVHVAEDQNLTGANFLANSLGVILRLGQNILSAMTASAFTIYDGLGNAASNIIATFGSTTTIGKTGDTQIVLDSDSLDIVAPDSNSVFKAAYSDSVIGTYGNVESGPYFTVGSRVSGDIGKNSATIGENNSAERQNAVSIGRNNVCAADQSVAIGNTNTLDGVIHGTSPNNGSGNFVAGSANTLHGTISGAIGYSNNVDAEGGYAMGVGLDVVDNQVALGHYNELNSGLSDIPLFVVGCGVDSLNRENAMWLDSQGDLFTRNGQVALMGTTLWESAAGSDLSTAVSLTESVENYDYVEVVYSVSGSNIRYMEKSAVYHSGTTHKAWVRLFTISSTTSNQIVMFTGLVTADGSSASSSGVNTVTLKTTPSVAIASSSNLRVHKIIGYK